MLTLFKLVIKWMNANSKDGVTAIEYGLIAALIALAIIGGATAVGTSLDTLFDSVSGDLDDAVGE
ncbi:MAG: Flp family type IVb pilin [Alphaproteobacteria bacterium]|jgi:pilus assembly protein Flp/PilA